MSLSSQNSRVSYTADGTVAEYSYTFKIFDDEDLLVTVRDDDGVETTLAKDDDYTVNGAGDAGGGSIELVDDGQDWINGSGFLAVGYVLVIRRVIDIVQETDIRNQGPFFPEIHEDQFDKGVMIDQQQQDEIDRSMKLSETTDPADFDATIPAELVGQSNVVFGTNAAGDGLEVGPSFDEISTAQSSAGAAAASAAAAATSETNAAASETAAAASAAAAAASASAAATSETNAATSEDNAASSETQAGNSATLAALAAADATTSKNAAATSATNAATSATNAATSATTASTQASNASTSATNAASSATAAAASATTAQNAANAAIWRDVAFKTFADSPITLSQSDAGKMFAIDTSGGAVVVNLPTISGLTLTSAFVYGIKKTTSDANSITINRGGSDTFDDATTSKTISTPDSGMALVPDTDPSPDKWLSVGFGAVAGNLTVDTFSGDGSTVAFVLSVSPGSRNNTWVTVGGVPQDVSSYTISGTTLTFSEAPPVGTSNIQVRSGTTLSIGTPSDSTVSNTKMTTMAQSTIKGRASGAGTGTVTDLTAQQVKDIINTAPTTQRFTSTGTTTGYIFTITSGNATVGATYTNNGQTFTVLSTIASATTLYTTSTGAPQASGTLTKASGTGDATLTFSAALATATYTPTSNTKWIRVRAVGGGGGGNGSGTSGGGAGGAGGTTYFGPALLIASGGLGGASSVGSAGGSGTINSPAYGDTVTGGSGGDANTTTGWSSGGKGGDSFWGGGAGGGGTTNNTPGYTGVANTGGGGGGGNINNTFAGSGGGGGGYVDAIIPAASLAASYQYAVGTGGTAGTAGTSGNAGGTGAAGKIFIEEFYI